MMSQAATADGLMNVRTRGAPPVANPYAAQRVESAPRNSKLPAITLGTVSTLVVLVGAWAGIVPFIGAIINFSADGSRSWYWDLSHTLLWMIPGAVAVVVGLMMLGVVRRVHSGVGRVVPAWGGLIVAVCGAWLVIGPYAWPAFEHGRTVFRSAAPLRELGLLLGWSLGPGLALVLLGGCALGISFRGRSVVVTKVVPAHAAVGPVTTPVATTPAASSFGTPATAPAAAATPAAAAWMGNGVSRTEPASDNRVADEGAESFPASDPPADWAGKESGPYAAEG
jgi:hypothetical protein